MRGDTSNAGQRIVGRGVTLGAFARISRIGGGLIETDATGICFIGSCMANPICQMCTTFMNPWRSVIVAIMTIVISGVTKIDNYPEWLENIS